MFLHKSDGSYVGTAAARPMAPSSADNETAENLNIPKHARTMQVSVVEDNNFLT